MQIRNPIVLNNNNNNSKNLIKTSNNNKKKSNVQQTNQIKLINNNNVNLRAGPDKSTKTVTVNTNASNQTGLNADDGYVMHQWRKERIWIEAINAEQRTRKNWDETWSFIAEYDQKGNVKPKKELPDRVNMYSEDIPNTCGHEYGSRLGTDIGVQMTVMQNSFNIGHKKRRNNDLICYD